MIKSDPNYEEIISYLSKIDVESMEIESVMSKL